MPPCTLSTSTAGRRLSIYHEGVEKFFGLKRRGFPRLLVLLSRSIDKDKVWGSGGHQTLRRNRKRRGGSGQAMWERRNWNSMISCSTGAAKLMEGVNLERGSNREGDDEEEFHDAETRPPSPPIIRTALGFLKAFRFVCSRGYMIWGPQDGWKETHERWLEDVLRVANQWLQHNKDTSN